ncbi:MAG: hypothetical protein JXI43_10240 [Tissierellales bacterium]|nr:hypothetical protein [Tissierellales bacterium]
MGLDLVEMIMSIEEHFGIEIPSEDSEHLTTPIKLINYVTGKVNIGKGGTNVCQTQKSFYEIRRVLVTKLGVPKKIITPSLTIKSILPAKNKYKFIERLSGELNFNSGLHLSHTTNFQRLIIYPSMLIFLVLLVVGSGYMDAALSMIISALIAFLTLILIFHFTPQLRTELSQSDYTIGDLARVLILRDKTGSKNNAKQWTRAEIDQDVRAIIMRELSVSNVNDNDHFIYDLGAG